VLTMAPSITTVREAPAPMVSLRTFLNSMPLAALAAVSGDSPAARVR
jgi:hypothetical protein